jgi:hypothetical protein
MNTEQGQRIPPVGRELVERKYSEFVSVNLDLGLPPKKLYDNLRRLRFSNPGKCFLPVFLEISSSILSIKIIASAFAHQVNHSVT